MRRRIYNLANGKFDEEKPELVFSEERLEIQVVEGQPYRGESCIPPMCGWNV